MTFKTPDFQNISFVLMDIEGTTSDIDFVKKVLFPYSARELRRYVSTHRNNPTVRQCLEDTKQPNDEAAIVELLNWIAKDVKHPSLKTLQGLIWKKGYEDEVYKAHLYPDVIPAWQKWQKAGLTLGIYSSGSVPAQELFFGYSVEGNVLNYLSVHFDLAIGGKREVESYRKIAQKLNLHPEKILFLSDVVEELTAAREARMKTAHIVRPGTKSVGFLPEAATFADL